MKLEILQHIKAALMEAVGNNTAIFYALLIIIWLSSSVLILLDPIEKYAHKDPAWKQELKTVLIKIFSMLLIISVLIII